MSQLRWAILAAVGGAQLGGVSCAGRSTSKDAGTGGTGALGGVDALGGVGGSKGGLGGSSAGTDARAGIGGDIIYEGGGRGAQGGNSGVGGGARGGTAGDAGAGPMSEFPCDRPMQRSADLVECGAGFVHRRAPATCPSPAGSGEGGGSGEGASGAGYCGASDECAPGERCLRTIETEPEDAPQCGRVCTDDDECASNEICACSSDFVSSEGAVTGICLPSSCRQDSDCEPGFLCIGVVVMTDCTPRPHEFHCQTPADECAGWGDCLEQGTGDDCRFNGTHHVCGWGEFCGRPFLVGGSVRIARPISGDGWSGAPVAGVVGALSAAARCALAEHFTDAALMEHASVAAFARFTLELLALGAPASLVQGSSRAMADEVRHARLCFGLAERYGGAPVAPGPLAVDGALAHVDLLRTVELAVLEGCIGETTAALEAAWAAEAATDASVRETLARIAEDEARHAALAFEFVAWAATVDARVPALAKRIVQQALEADAHLPHGNERALAEPDVLAAHGVLDATSRRAARSVCLREIVAAVGFDRPAGPRNAAVLSSMYG